MGCRILEAIGRRFQEEQSRLHGMIERISTIYSSVEICFDVIIIIITMI